MIVTEDPIQVIEVAGNRVKIRATRLSLCAHCHIQVLPSEMQILEVWVEDHIGVQPRELVQLGMASRHFLLSVGIVFGLHLVGLFGGVFLALMMYSHFHGLLSLPLWEALLGLVGIGLSLFGLRQFDQYVLRKPGFLPSLIKKVRVNPERLSQEI